ncbi:MAG: creatininase [Parvibaculaceae bacterium]
MSDNVLISELSWTRYAERLERDNPVIILPVGSLEQHGPHSPLATDTIVPTEIGKAVAGKIGGLVAPAIAYGYKSMPRTGGGNHFPGTVSLDGDTLVRLTRDIICEFARHGARSLLILDSHYENEMFLIEGIDLALKDLRSRGIDDLKVMKVRYFEFISDAMLAKVFPEGFPGWPLEHAGVMTTSVLLHLRPDLVHMDRVPNQKPVIYPPYDLFPVDAAQGTQTGILATAKGASPEKGKLLFDEVVEGISGAVREAFRS